MLCDPLSEAAEQIAPDVGVTDLATTELDRDLDAIAILKEADSPTHLRIEVALADLYAEPDLLELD